MPVPSTDLDRWDSRCVAKRGEPSTRRRRGTVERRGRSLRVKVYAGTGCRVVTYELAGPEDRLPCPKVKVSGLARLDFLGCPGPCARRDERWNADQDSDPRNDAAPVYVESVVSTRTRCHGVLLPKMAAPELRSAATEQSASAVWVHEA